MPNGYYIDPMTNARADQRVLCGKTRPAPFSADVWSTELLEKCCPRLSTLLDKLEIELQIVAFHWFFILFVDCFDTNTTLSVWEAVLLNGSEVCMAIDSNHHSVLLRSSFFLRLPCSSSMKNACWNSMTELKFSHL